MPELPEVETIVRDLQSLVVGRKVKSVRTSLEKIVKTGAERLVALLTGAEVLAATRRGKFIVLSFTGDRYLVVHLKMTGQFLWGPPPDGWPRHVHVIIEFEGGMALQYRDIRQFGYLLGLTGQEYREWLETTDIGPDPSTIGPEEFSRRLLGRKGKIKPVLLDQSLVSGLGNIYVDESLFASGINPLTPVQEMDEQQACLLHEKMCGILAEAVKLRGSTTNNYVGLSGEGGHFQNNHKVYGRKGEPCPVCGAELVRTVVAGRGTHYCPCCQPEK